MISPREESEMPSEQAPGATGSGVHATNESLDIWLHLIAADLRRVLENVRRTALVEVRRMQLKAIDGFFRGGLYLCLLVAALILSACAMLLLIGGTRAGLRELTGRAWSADLLTALILVILLGCAGWAVHVLLRLQVVRRAEHQLKAPAAGRAKAALN
jgi:hypothetical protein